ncbi:cation:proton antiporter [bacterium]|nr:cation:proton antiporter [bacterium]
MTHSPFLYDLLVIVVAAVIAAALVRKVHFPTVAGLLLAGALVGPYGLALTSDVERINQLAEIGVILLLFTIGLELSLSRLAKNARLVLAGGGMQVAFTILAVAVLAAFAGLSTRRAIFFGFLFALSSTAIVLRVLMERSELDAPHGRMILSVLIFQDLCVVPMMLLTPILGGQTGDSVGLSVAIALAKAAIVVAATVLVARVVIPPIFARVDATRSREVFVLAVIGVCAGAAYATEYAGMSLALGAFLAGLMLSDTEYGHRAMTDVLPLRDVFLSVFFVSMGMLMDVRLFATRPVAVAAMLAGFLLLKGAIAGIIALASGAAPRTSWLTAVGLAQFGEFGFVLAGAGHAAGLADTEDLHLVLTAGVLSMFATPILIAAAPRFAGERLFSRLSRLSRAKDWDETPPPARIADHVVIVGYGLAGRHLATTLRRARTPYLLYELNAETVRRARREGEPIHYGDITSPETIHKAGAERARAVVLLINDPQAARRAIHAIRHHAPKTPIFARARYAVEAEHLSAMGASEVVIEEVEGAHAVARLLMERLTVVNDVNEK